MTMATSYHGNLYGHASIHRRRTGSLGSLEGVDPNNLPEHHRQRRAGLTPEGSLANFFSATEKTQQHQMLPEDMQSCTSSVAQNRRWELEEQRALLESKLMKLDRRQDRRKTKLKLQPGHTLDEVTATTVAESSASSSHHSSGEHSNGASCTACLTKEKMVQKQLKELQQLRLENMKLRGIPLQVMKIVEDDDSTESGAAGSGITNHVIATTPEEQYNLAVINGEEQARQQEGESVQVENMKYDLAYPMTGFTDRTEGRRRGIYTGPVHSLSPHLPHGKGGKLVFLDEDGLEDDVYEGDFRQGEMHGEGTYKWTETGNVYKGSFWHNLRHGFGHYTNEKYAFEGTFSYDKPHGDGKQTSRKDKKDVIYDGQWEHGKKKKNKEKRTTSKSRDGGDDHNNNDWATQEASTHSRRSKKGSHHHHNSRSKSPTRSSTGGGRSSKHRRKSLDLTAAITDGEDEPTMFDDEGTVNTRRSSRKARKSTTSNGRRRKSATTEDDGKSTRSSKTNKSSKSRKGSSKTTTNTAKDARRKSAGDVALHHSAAAEGGGHEKNIHRSSTKSVGAYSMDDTLHTHYDEDEDAAEEGNDHVAPMSVSPTMRRRLRRKESVRSMGNTKPVESRRDLMAQGFTDDEDETLEGDNNNNKGATTTTTTAPTAPLTLDDDMFATMDMSSSDLYNPFQKS